ncbi:MAG: aminomethyl-transferring glycine dehydrogenase subunit GcvPA [Waddliaceae bacterium]
MDFIANQSSQIQEMLEVIGITDPTQLYRDIPNSLILPPPKVDDGLSEYEGLQWMRQLSKKNTFVDDDNYLGAGAYEHHIPAICDAIGSRSEFLTAYTPYQAEASQGMLQTIFEFQTAVCALTGMDVANASVYDGASACAEALLMALRLHRGKRKVILVSEPIHPHYRKVIDQYLENHDVTLKAFSSKEDLDDQVAALLVSYPNFHGVIEDFQPLFEEARKKGILNVVLANPLIYGLFPSAKALGGDIAVGDLQPFGLPMRFGGPFVGYMATRRELVRQLPGRIVGRTEDDSGRTGYVLTMQAREQHIRREKATSNICTNQAHAALLSLIAILWYGKEGVKELALANYRRAAYLKEGLSKIPGVKVLGDNHLNEFVVRFNRDVVEHFRKNHIQPGVPLENHSLLVAVTETKSKEQLDRYLKVAAEAMR